MTSPPGASTARRVENPPQGDIVTFIETSAESGGERTLLELEVAPGGAVPPHRHVTYFERFRGREGRLTLELAGARHDLAPGDVARRSHASAQARSAAGQAAAAGLAGEGGSLRRPDVVNVHGQQPRRGDKPETGVAT
jgi:hypothetical protein